MCTARYPFIKGKPNHRIRRLVVIARRLRKMNKPTPPLGIPSVARFHSEICRNCHVFDGPGDSTGGAHLNMKEEE